MTTTSNSKLPVTTNDNPPAQAPFFTPEHAHSPGTPWEVTDATPTLFQPLTIRGVTLRNRFIVAPMCQYSVASPGPEKGHLTDYHIATLGHYALKGAGLVFIEATGVQPNGRISPNCPGLWEDSQIAPVKRVADFLHSQGALCAMQLAHAGRKASTTAPWIGSAYRRERGWGPGSVRATADVGGWPDDVVGPSGGITGAYGGGDERSGHWVPRELTETDIKTLVEDFGKAAARAVAAGVDVIEIHSAHGYLLHQFLSPVTNKRTDQYGGSFENRVRLHREVVEEVRRNIPANMPLFFRVSCTDWLEDTDVEAAAGGSWTVEDTIELANRLPDWGVDLLDVSSGGNHPQQNSDLFSNKGYQVSRAGRIRKAVRNAGKTLLVGAVGLITEAEDAKRIVQSPGGAEDRINDEAQAAASAVQQDGVSEPQADAILIGRQFMREPEWVLRVAWQLGVPVAWPSQFLRVSFP